MDEAKRREEGELEAVAVPAEAADPLATVPVPRVHLVVVCTRALGATESTVSGATLRARFWHPRDHRWSEGDFASLDEVRRRFVEEEGWPLRQEQSLDAPLSHELIFEARRIDFATRTQGQILRDFGMTPESVSEMLGRVDRDQQNG